MGYYGGGNNEDYRAALFEPLHAKITQRAFVQPAPIPWQIGREEAIARNIVGDFRGTGGQVDGLFIRSNIYKEFERY